MPVRHEAQHPRVSVGLPVYNGDRWLDQALRSLLGQTFTDFELIICDNASTDETAEICRRYAERDTRVRYLRNPRNIGGMRNATLTFELAHGEYFRWAAHDDICDPTLLERMVEVLDSRPAVVAAVSPFISISEDGAPLANCCIGISEGTKLWWRRLDRQLMTDDIGVRHPTDGTAATPSKRFREVIMTVGPCEGTYGLIRSNVLRDTCLQQPYTSSDKVMLCDLVLRGPFHILDEPLLSKRWHSSNLHRELGPGRMVWSRPELAWTGRPTLPYWLQLWGYITIVARAPLSLAERVRCGISVLRWMRFRWGLLRGDLTCALRMSVHSREWRRRCYDTNRWTESDGPAPEPAELDPAHAV